VGISTPVNITVIPPPPGPVITAQPGTRNVQQGGGVVFCVRVEGARPMNYQWLFNGTPIDGATNTYLILNGVQTNNAGDYAVIITNPWGSTNSLSAVLNVNPPPQPCGNTNAVAALYFPNLELMDPGVPLITINATNLSAVQIYWTSNCLSWTPLLALTNYGGTLYFADPDALNQPFRMYRAVAVP